MSFRIRIRWRWLQRTPVQQTSGYRLRPSSFATSVGLHSIAIAALGLIPTYYNDSRSRKPVFDELIRPDEHKITWYDFRKPLPQVTAVRRIGTFPRPRGKELSKQAIIATAPRAKSTKQFIWQPVPKIQIRQDLPAPNLIARAAMAIPAPPPLPEPKKVEERPEVEAPRALQPNSSPPAPDGDVNRAHESTTNAIEVPQPRKAFVPPPSRAQPSRLTIPVAAAEVPMPDTSIVGSPSMRTVLPEGMGAPAFSKGAAPPSNAPPGPTTNAGNAKVDIAIAGLHPADKLTGPLPEGSRPGQFSKAPTVGETATGEVKGVGLTVPNLSIREDTSKPSPAPFVGNRKIVLYAEQVRGIPVSTLSVPLRPATRTIPRAIDARFQRRYVYTMVIPIENLQGYSGDWILWFAEREQKPGDTPVIRAPIPLRKFESVEPIPPGARTELRVQMSALIKRDGKIDSIVLLRSTGPVLEQAVIKDLGSWEFKPAMRDGVPVDVDVVLEIPFSLPPEIAKRAQP